MNKINWKIVIPIVLVLIILMVIGFSIKYVPSISCLILGGEMHEGYGLNGPNGLFTCRIPAKDVGKICTYNDECESGACRYKYGGSGMISHQAIGSSGTCAAFSDSAAGDTVCDRDRGQEKAQCSFWVN